MDASAKSRASALMRGGGMSGCLPSRRATREQAAACGSVAVAEPAVAQT